MYQCRVLDEVANACIEWAIVEDVGFLGFSQADSYIIGKWLIAFFSLCCAYAIITKAIKQS